MTAATSNRACAMMGRWRAPRKPAGSPWAYWQFDSDFTAYDMATDDWVEPILYALVPPQDADKR